MYMDGNIIVSLVDFTSGHIYHQTHFINSFIINYILTSFFKVSVANSVEKDFGLLSLGSGRVSF